MDPAAYGTQLLSGMRCALRQWGCGGLVVDWDLRTNLEACMPPAGRLRGGGALQRRLQREVRRQEAAAYAAAAADAEVSRAQVEKEKARVYARWNRADVASAGRSSNAGICRVMQDYCGEHKSETTLRRGCGCCRAPGIGGRNGACRQPARAGAVAECNRSSPWARRHARFPARRRAAPC